MTSTKEQLAKMEVKGKMREMIDNERIFDFVIHLNNKATWKGFFLGVVVTWISMALGSLLIN